MPQVSSTRANARERRNAERVRLLVSLPIRIARRDGHLVDLGRGGARVRHPGPLKLGSSVDMSFAFGTLRFACAARVVACRVAHVTSDGSPPVYETSVTFAGNADTERAIELILSGSGPEMT